MKSIPVSLVRPPIRALFGVNEVEAVINKLVGEKNGVEYKEKEGIVIRYFEHHFIPFDQYYGRQHKYLIGQFGN